MDCANASVYDGGSALFEAMMMAMRKDQTLPPIVIDEALSPIYRIMLSSYTSNLEIELVTVPQTQGTSDIQALMNAVDENCAAVVVQNPHLFRQRHGLQRPVRPCQGQRAR